MKLATFYVFVEPEEYVGGSENIALSIASINARCNGIPNGRHRALRYFDVHRFRYLGGADSVLEYLYMSHSADRYPKDKKVNSQAVGMKDDQNPARPDGSGDHAHYVVEYALCSTL